MVVRQSIKNPNINPTSDKDRLQSGYEGQNIPDDFYLPPCGLEDIDRALFSLFDEEIGFAVTQNNSTKKIPVVFATGERFALIKRRVPIRDENDSFILPLISIRRSSIEQADGLDRLADVGELILKRRLSTRDPIYQNLNNPKDLKNQHNVRSANNNAQASDPQGSLPGRVNSRRLPPKTAAGGPVLASQVSGKHIYEIITIPFPNFIDVTYEITFWTSYTQHMNHMIEKLVSSYTGNKNQFKITTDKGYWFVAYPAGTVTNGDNFDDFTNEQRIVRYSFNMTVPAYIVAPQGPGAMTPFRKYVSAPDLSFEIFSSNSEILVYPENEPDPTGDVDKFMLSEVEQINTAGNIVESDRFRYLKAKHHVINPFTQEGETEYLKILTRNQRQGETVLSSKIVTKIGDL